MREATGRAIRINELRAILKEVSERGEFADEKKLIAQLSLKWNIATRKVKEYLQVMIDAEEIIRLPEGLKKI